MAAGSPNTDLHGYGEQIRKEVGSRVPRDKKLKVLDVGTGFGINVAFLARWLSKDSEVWTVDPSKEVLANVKAVLAAQGLPGVKFVEASADDLDFADGSFDIVFSNSVIEHVGDAASQRRFALEVARVGRSYWVQTPNRWFPIEQHLLTPFLHWMPRRWQRALAPRCNLWLLLVRASPDRRRYYIEHYLGEIRLLSAACLRDLFPDARAVAKILPVVLHPVLAPSRPYQHGISPLQPDALPLDARFDVGGGDYVARV